MMQLAACLTAWLAVLQGAEQEKAPGFLEIGEIRKTFKAVFPVVVAETGRTSEIELDVKIGTPEKLAEMLRAEMGPQMKVLSPGLDDEARREQVEIMARLMSRAMLAKFGMKDKTIYVNPKTFEEFGAVYEDLRVNTPEMLRTVLIHETVHALDEEAFGISSRIGGAKTAGELEILNSLFEGHAQYVTRRILTKEDKSEVFERFERLVISPPPGLEEGERFVASVFSMALVTAYVDGRRFFEELEKEGRKDFVSEVFGAPPKDRRVIFNPERYYHPERTPKGRDLAAMWKAVDGRFGGQWTRVQRKVDPSELAKAFGGMLDKDEIDGSMRTVVDSHVLVLNYKPAPGMKLIIFSVSELESVGAARRFYDLDLKLMKVKDERMKKGTIRIAKAEYGSLDTRKPERLSLAKKEVQAGPQTVRVKSVLFQADRFVCEVVYSNEEVEDPELVKLVDVMCGYFGREY